MCSPIKRNTIQQYELSSLFQDKYNFPMGFKVLNMSYTKKSCLFWYMFLCFLEVSIIWYHRNLPWVVTHNILYSTLHLVDLMFILVIPLLTFHVSFKNVYYIQIVHYTITLYICLKRFRAFYLIS